VHAEDFFINKCAYRHDVEGIRESFPQFNVVLSFTLIKMQFTLIVKTINAVDTRAFVVASEHEEILRVFDFICQHQADGFD
jgi:hypothetical protein